MSANDHQVAGNHYQTEGEQHWDRQWKLHGRGYFVGCITKYVERYHRKNGLQDLEKARHFLDKLIELESSAITTNTPYVATAKFDQTTTIQFKGTLPAEEPGRNYVKQD